MGRYAPMMHRAGAQIDSRPPWCLRTWTDIVACAFPLAYRGRGDLPGRLATKSPLSPFGKGGYNVCPGTSLSAAPAGQGCSGLRLQRVKPQAARALSTANLLASPNPDVR